jgi:replication initiation protein RepC
MSAALMHTGLPEGVKPYHLLALVKDVARSTDSAFRISRTAVALLEYCIASCRDGDFLKGKICGVWEQPATIAAKLRISTKVLHNAEAELRSKGLIERTSTAHARRQGERRNDKIVSLAGISLRPLINGFNRLVAARDAMQLQQQALSVLRSEIAQLRRQIREVENVVLIDQAEDILPRGRTSRITKIEQLEAIRADLEAVLVCIELPSGEHVSSDRTEEIFSPIILTQDSLKKSSGAGEPRSGHIEPATVTPEVATRLASEDYQALLDAKGGPTWQNLIETSAAARIWLGISQAVWGDACQQMGRERAALCVLVIDRNWRLPEQHRYHRSKPEASLRGMIRKGGDNLNLMGLLQAVQGYQDGADGNNGPNPPYIVQAAPEDAGAIGKLLPRILANVDLTELGGGA